MPHNNLVFRLKVTPEEVEQMILRFLQLDNQIGTTEEKYFTQMTKIGKNFFMEFVVPQPKPTDDDER